MAFVLLTKLSFNSSFTLQFTPQQLQFQLLAFVYFSQAIAALHGAHTGKEGNYFFQVYTLWRDISIEPSDTSAFHK